MWAYLRDKLATARLRAAWERQLQEQLQTISEAGAKAVAEEPGDWLQVGKAGTTLTAQSRGDLRDQVRRLVHENPHARNVLRLLEAYVVGDSLSLTLAPRRCCGLRDDDERLHQLEDWWRDFLRENEAHFSYRELARRVWRDGEAFLRFFPGESGPPQVRFIDPERIAGSPDAPETQGILTDPDDVETVEAYLVHDREDPHRYETVEADEIVHIRYGVDTNEKRGVSFFASLVEPLEKFEEWQNAELLARKLQASLVLWRKVQGGAAQAGAMADGAQTGFTRNPHGGVRQERIRPGTILTTSAGTEMKFLQPDTNYTDAVPLGRMLLLSAAAGAGLPEFMLTADASNSNYASTMIAEGPAVKLFRGEQDFMIRQFNRLWHNVMQEGMRQRQIDEDVTTQVELHWATPELVSRDRPREREADIRLLEAGVLSRAEIQRREKLDPEQINQERHHEP